MKPPPFDYVRVSSVEDAVRALADAGGDGKILAGGQSLVPMMALRIARPSPLVDINRIPGLSGVRQARDGEAVRIGTLTRHAALAGQRQHPLLAEAASWIGHPAIRSRGTVGGSIAHADPAAEIPVVAAALDAVIEIAGPASSREIPASDLFAGAFETVLAGDEMITSVTFPVPRRWGFAELARRRGDFGLVTVVAAEAGDRIRVAVGGTGATPWRAAGAEDVLAGAGPPGAALTPAVIERAAAAAAAGAPASGDLHAPAGFRRAMTVEFTRRALAQLAGAPETEGAR